jgi:hypothetical protein
MARLTFDAIAIQSVIGAGESLSLLEAAQRAFCPDQTSVSQVAVMRTRRACQVLKERGLVELDEQAGLRLRSVDTSGASALQLSAIITRTIFAAHESDDVLEEDETNSGAE